MLHVIPFSLEWRRDTRLHAMFHARKRVFVDLLKWEVPVLEQTFEIDQFDAHGAVYLVLTDATGAHLASTRLLPTTGAHILDTLFPHISEKPLPRGADVLEITRFCLDRRIRGVERLELRNQLVSAIADYGVSRGIKTYTGVAEMSWLQQILAFGWRCRPLGLPIVDGRSTLGALSIEIDRDTPRLLARAGVYRRCVVAMDSRDAA